MQQGTKLKTYFDDLGNRWIVNKTDPGNVPLELAKKFRIRYITLPSEALLGNEPKPSDWEAVESMITAGDFDIDVLRAVFCVNLLREELKKMKRESWLTTTAT